MWSYTFKEYISRMVALVVIAHTLPTVVNAASETMNPYTATLSGWETVLNEFVDVKGRVDFQGVSENDSDLNAFVAAIAQVSPTSHPELFPNTQHVIAYHINAYNALAMHGVLERGIPAGFTSFTKRASFFRFRGVVVGGEKTNLYTYENAVIRPLGEARVHFALNCMVKSCPRLPMTAFRPETLEKQLQEATLEFFANPAHLRVDDEKEIVEVSSILKFYTEDFAESGKRQDLTPYIERYSSRKIPANYKVRYMKYDWRLNKQP